MNPLTRPASPAVTRRDALKTLGAGAALLGLGLAGGSQSVVPSHERGGRSMQPHVFPKAPYVYDALEPQFITRSGIHLPLA